MKKVIGLALVSAMVGLLPLVASAQVKHEMETTHTKTTESGGEKKTTTSHSTKPMTEEQKKNPVITTTKKETTHKTSGKPATHTTEKTTTKKPMHKATTKTTKTVKTGQSAVKGSHTEKNPCEVKGTEKKKEMHKETMKTPEKETTTTTGKSEVKEAPSTAPEKKEGPVQKVEQGAKKTGEEIKQGWDKMIHKDDQTNQNKK